VDFIIVFDLNVCANVCGSERVVRSARFQRATFRLGIAPITLLRAREAGGIRIFRIGTRVLYCAEHLTDFLNACERNQSRTDGEGKSHAPRKENRVSSARGSIREGGPRLKSDSQKKEQAPLPFAASS
jgi:hypothetical protein